jgi:hypothetical protein
MVNSALLGPLGRDQWKTRKNRKKASVKEGDVREKPSSLFMLGWSSIFFVSLMICSIHPNFMSNWMQGLMFMLCLARFLQMTKPDMPVALFYPGWNEMPFSHIAGSAVYAHCLQTKIIIDGPKEDGNLPRWEA